MTTVAKGERVLGVVDAERKAGKDVCPNFVFAGAMQIPSQSRVMPYSGSRRFYVQVALGFNSSMMIACL